MTDSVLATPQQLLSPLPTPSKPSYISGEGLLPVGDIPGTRRAIYDRVLSAASNIAPFSNGRREMRIVDVHYRPADPEDYTPAEHKRAILENRTLGRRLRGTVVLHDIPTGKELDRKTLTLATVPWLSGDGAFVSNGVDTSVSHQMRLRPGSYTRVKQTGEIENHVNVLPGKGPSHRYRLDPETGKFVVEIHQAQLPLMPLLRAAGLTDQELEAAWGAHGKELVALQRESDTPHNLARVYKAVAGRKADANFAQMTRPEQLQALAALLPSWEIDSDISQKTLGGAYSTIDKDALKAITSKLIRVAAGEDEADDRDQLAYQKVLGPDDLFAERIARDYGRTQRSLFNEAARRGNLQHLSPGILQKQLQSVFTKSGLANSLEEANPSEILDRVYRVSRMGEGGLPSTDSIPQESRMVSPSHYGFIDPARTVECFDSETEVMTHRGWVGWPHVMKTDRFACLLRGRLAYRCAEKLYVGEYDGPLYGAETSRISYLVTPDHRMWVRPAETGCLGYRFERAEDSHGSSRKLLCGGHRPYRGKDHDLKYFEVPPCPVGGNNQNELEPIPIDDWYEFLGWYLAEGSYVYEPETPSYRTDISQSADANPDNYARIAALLSRIFPKYSGDSIGFSISGKQLSAYLSQFGGSAERHIPACAFEAPVSSRKRLLESLLLGDGSRDPRRDNRRMMISSGSEKMADDVQCLLFGLGIASRITVGKDKRSETYLPRHKVNIHDNQERVVGRRCGKLTVEMYRGNVYCATVPGGLLYVRRHKKTGHWSGNSLRVGVDLYLAGKLRRDADGNIYAPIRNTETGQTEWRTPREISELPLGFNEQSDNLNVPAIVNGKLQYADRNLVKHRPEHFEDAFSPLAQLIPMKSGTPAQRVAMGSRMCLAGHVPLLVLRGSQVWRGPIEKYKHKDGDRLLSIDKNTQQQCWLPVVGLTRLPNKKEMRKVVLTDGSTVETTADHRFVTVGNDGELLEVAAKDLSPGMPVPRAGHVSLPSRRYCWKVPPGEKHNAHPPVEIQADYRLGWLHGLYVSEGNVNTHRRTGRVQGATLANLDAGVIAYAMQTCLLNNIPAKERSGRPDGQVDRVVIDWKQFALRLKADFGDGSYVKKLPAWVYTASRDYRRGLIAGYLAGDGTVAAHRDAVRVEGGSRSCKLRDDLVDLLLTIGIAATKTARQVDTGPKGATVTHYCFHVRSDCHHLLPRLHHPGKDALLAARPWSGRRSADRVPLYAEMKRKLIAGTCRSDRNRWRTYVDRHTRTSMIEVLGVDDDTRESRWLRSAVRWESVDRVETATMPSYVYDIDMGDNVFACAGGVFVHNCTQAVALTNPEAPLVRGAVDGDPSRSYEEQYGSVVGALRADRGGEVLLVSPDSIRVRYDDGEIKDIGLDNNRPMNRKSFRHQTPVVEMNQRFAPGELLAKSNYTDDKGAMALGANFRTAYMPFRGLNHEDAIVISRSAAKRLQSEHAYQHTMDRSDDVKFGREAFRSVFPGKFSQEVMSRLDEDGVIKPGQTVNYGDPLVTAMSQSDDNPGRLLRGKRPISRDVSLLWEHHAPGVVTDAVKTKDGVNVVVKSLNEMQTGDKLSGRVGDKGVVHIVPDEHMPQDKDGKPIEVIVSDLGVLSRGNASQVAEALLGKVARKTGQHINVPDFKDIDDLTDWAKQLAAQHGISDQEDLYDPVENRKIPGVLTGERFFMKLHHLSESKGQGRGIGGYTQDERPAKSGETGCFVATQRVVTSRGWMPIGRICEKRRGEQVLTYSERLQEWVFRPITNWFVYDAPVEDVLSIECFGPCENDKGSDVKKYTARHHINATKNHKMKLFDGSYKLAGELQVGDELVTWGVEPTQHQHEILVGMLMGDGSVDKNAIMCTHSGKQSPYFDWKLRMLASLSPTWCEGFNKPRVTRKGYINHGGRYRVMSLCNRLVAEPYARLCLRNGQRTVTAKWLAQMTGLSVAVLFLDDGTATYKGMTAKSRYPAGSLERAKFTGAICTQGFTRKGVQRLRRWLMTRYDIKCSIGEDNRINLSARACRALIREVARWIPWQVIPRSKRGIRRVVRRLQEVTPPQELKVTSKLTKRPMPVRSISPYRHRKGRKTLKVYDIEVAGTHTYCAGPSLVSNSKTIGLLQSNAIMSHGATGLLRDVAEVRGQSNPEYWMAVRQGIAPPAPRVPYTYQKFVNELQAGGIHVASDGTQINVMALTDKDIDRMAGSREITRNDLVRLDDELSPVRGGLFDPTLTGGHGGCFHASVQVWTDKGMLPIGEIVEKRLAVKVWSYDFKRERFVLRPITNWFRNRAADGIGCQKFKSNGRLSAENRRFSPTTLWGTAKHQVFDISGNKFDLSAVKSLTAVQEKLTYSQEQCLYGSLLGDGHVSAKGCYTEAHSVRQKPYLELKRQILLPFAADELIDKLDTSGNAKPRWKTHFRTISHAEFHAARAECYAGERKTVTQTWLDRLDAMGLAFLYLDDGTTASRGKKNTAYCSFATCAFSRREVELLQQWLLDKFGIESQVGRDEQKYAGRDAGWCINLCGEDAERLFEVVAPYTPACMLYKLGKRPRCRTCCRCPKQIDQRRRICNRCQFDECRTRGASKLPKSTRRMFGGSAAIREMLRTERIPEDETPTLARWLRRQAEAGNALERTAKDNRPQLSLVEIPCKWGRGSNKKWANTRTVYDITVAGTHNYVANGILVSNSHWSRIRLPEPMPSPVMEEPIRRLLGLTTAKFRDVLAGKDSIDSGSGPQAIYKALDAIDIPKELDRVRKALKHGRKSDRDLAERQLGYLKGAQKTGQHPREWMVNSIPVLPPQFRPITLMQHNDQPQVADINYLYREAIDARDNLRDMKQQVDDVSDERLGLYDAFGAITGLVDPQHPKLVEKQVGGVLQRVFGKGSAKYGTVQRKLLSRQVDLVGRAVVVPNPDLDIDSVGLPENRAWPLYNEFVVGRLRRRGFPVARAMAEVQNRTPLAREELLREMEKRPVYVDRAPVWHRFGTLAFYPRLVAGDSMHVSPAVLTGFAMDFDGDTAQYHVPANDEAIPEILERMLPSRNLLSPADFKTPMPVAGKEFIGGLFTATKPAREGARVVRFLNRKAAIEAARRGELPLDTPVEVDD